MANVSSHPHKKPYDKKPSLIPLHLTPEDEAFLNDILFLDTGRGLSEELKQKVKRLLEKYKKAA
jgi:hypothetical protein